MDEWHVLNEKLVQMLLDTFLQCKLVKDDRIRADILQASVFIH